MFESIPIADFMNEFKNYMSCWKSIVFAGIAIKEGASNSPIALQAWAGSDDQEHTALFKTPKLPSGICMFKVTRWLTKAWPMLDDILDQKTLALNEDTIVSFADFKFENAAFLTSVEYHDEYPKELHKYIGSWPKLYLQGKFENCERLVQEFNSKVEQEFKTGRYLYPTFQDAANHLIGIRVNTAYQWGLLYLVLSLPIKLKAELKTYIKGEKVVSRLEIPTRLDRLSIDVRYLVESKLGERFESCPIKKGTHSEGRQVLSSTLILHSGERCKEVSLHLGGKRVISAHVEEANRKTAASTQTHPNKEYGRREFKLQESSIGDDIYQEILQVIHDTSKVFERLPKTYADKDEEALRDHFILQLEPRFEGSATGETFNKSGKTDILIRHEKSNIFVAECEWWAGPKKHLEKIDQLLSYLAWQDSKTAIVCFVGRKNFSSTLKKIVGITQQHSCYVKYVGAKDETWHNFEFHLPGDLERKISLSVLAFHLPKER